MSDPTRGFRPAVGTHRERRPRSAGLVLGLCLPLIACAAQDGVTSGPQATPSEARVRVGPVERRAFPVVYPVTGTVVPRERIEIASRVSGFLRQVTVREGDRVEPGALLVAIDDVAVEAAVRGAEAALASARAEVAEAQGDVERFRHLSRTQALAEDELRKAELHLARAEASREGAEAELTARRQDRQYARLVSPARAQVRERLRDPGDLVTVGDPILRLDVLGSLELELFVPSAQASVLAAGQRVQVELDEATPAIDGQIDAVVDSADPVTRRCKVRVALPQHGSLVPGRFARAQLVLGEDSVFAVPASALTERAGVPGVFVVDPSGTARFRSVHPGRLWQDLREIRAGVEMATRVVIAPSAALRDGDRVLVERAPDGP